MSRPAAGMSVLITGASAGIGRALAQALDARGARLTLSARRGDKLDELNRSLGGRHQVVVADVSVPADCDRLVDAAASHHGRLDTVVCNAGHGLSKAAADTTSAEMTDLFKTNVFGTADVIRRAVPVMKNQAVVDRYRGQIVIVSSAIARRAVPYSGAYAATKAAQLSLAESLRVELKPTRIAVTSVHPIGTSTEFFDLAGKIGDPAVPPPSAREVRQSAATVAAAIARGIARPRPEVWPARLARIGLSFSTLLPGLTDWALADFRRPAESARANAPRASARPAGPI